MFAVYYWLSYAVDIWFYPVLGQPLNCWCDYHHWRVQCKGGAWHVLNCATYPTSLVTWNVHVFVKKCSKGVVSQSIWYIHHWEALYFYLYRILMFLIYFSVIICIWIYLSCYAMAPAFFLWGTENRWFEFVWVNIEFGYLVKQTTVQCITVFLIAHCLVWGWKERIVTQMCDNYNFVEYLFITTLINMVWIHFLVFVVLFSVVKHCQRPEQSCRHFVDDIFKCILYFESLKFIPTGPIDKKSLIVQVMAWRW